MDWKEVFAELVYLAVDKGYAPDSVAQGFSIISDHPKYMSAKTVSKLEREFDVRYYGEISERTFQGMGNRENIYSPSNYLTGCRYSDGSVVIPFGDSNSLFVSAEAPDVTPATETELESLLGL